MRTGDHEIPKDEALAAGHHLRRALPKRALQRRHLQAQQHLNRRTLGQSFVPCTACKQL